MLRNPRNDGAMSSPHETECHFRDPNHGSVLMLRFDNPGFLSGPPVATDEAHGILQRDSNVYD